MTDLKQYIRQKEQERSEWEFVINKLEELQFTEKTHKEVFAILSSKIAQCDISIRDHKRLI